MYQLDSVGLDGTVDCYHKFSIKEFSFFFTCVFSVETEGVVGKSSLSKFTIS